MKIKLLLFLLFTWLFQNYPKKSPNGFKRLIFTFKYKVHLKFKIGIFGGLAVTAILYFMLFKGLSNLSFMTPETKEFINTHIAVILGVCFVVLSIIMQILHFLKINVLRIVVLLGTFALAMACFSFS